MTNYKTYRKYNVKGVLGLVHGVREKRQKLTKHVSTTFFFTILASLGQKKIEVITSFT